MGITVTSKRAEARERHVERERARTSRSLQYTVISSRRACTGRLRYLSCVCVCVCVVTTDNTICIMYRYKLSITFSYSKAVYCN